MKLRYLIKFLFCFLFMIVTGFVENRLHLGIPVNFIAFLCIPLGSYFLIMAARCEYKSVMKEVEDKNE